LTDRPAAANEVRLPIGDMPVKAYGKYFLVKKLAEGGMAEIFLAKQVGVEGFEKNVVIKRMLPHLSVAPDFVSMFLDEARLAASLTHPNIVQISDLGLADGCYFICMEYLAGEDFATVLRTAKRRGEQAPLTIVLRVLAEAAVGLHYAHEAVNPKGDRLNLVHRDISPSNIFITYSGQVKVLDFGIAKAESRVTTTTAGVVKGKYQYMSPEQARGDFIDRRSDIFSMGVSMYEALTGTRPFARESDLAVLKAVLEGDYVPVRALRPDVPVEVEQILAKAMALEADERYPSALAVAQDIERYIGATTSTSGGQALVSFMAGFFGPDRVRSKTRIESLDELARRGVDVPGYKNPLTSKTEIELDIVDDSSTKVVGAPVTVRAQQLRRMRWWVAAALVLGIVGTVLMTRFLGPHAAVMALVDAGMDLDDVDAGEPDAGVPGTDDAGVGDRDAGPKPQVANRPVSLTTAMVVRSISQNKGRFEKCFSQYKGELPSNQGTLLVTFAIASTGKVSSVTTTLPGTQVSACIERIVLATVFPRHVDISVSVPLPLNWDLR
jgi:serine/threonine protein kinase